MNVRYGHGSSREFRATPRSLSEAFGDDRAYCIEGPPLRSHRTLRTMLTIAGTLALVAVGTWQCLP